MYAITWLVCAGLLIVAVVFAIAADCVGSARDDEDPNVDDVREGNTGPTPLYGVAHLGVGGESRRRRPLD